MTVALDLDAKKTADKAQLDMLKQCASRSRYARDPADLTKGKKLFWNATGATLSQTSRRLRTNSRTCASSADHFQRCAPAPAGRLLSTPGTYAIRAAVNGR